jgi:hypothetical protein
VLPARQHHLDRADARHAGAGMREGRPWWQAIRKWPLFATSAAELAFERLSEGRMPPRPAQPGEYGCAAGCCADLGEEDGWGSLLSRLDRRKW